MKSTPVPRRTRTATPLPTVTDVGDDISPGDVSDSSVDAAAAAPISPGTMTSSIFVFNPDTSTATVGITIIKSDGTTAYTFPTFTVAANGAVAKSLPSSIKSPFAGSAVVSSDKNVQAFVTDSNENKPARDEYEGTLSPNANLVLPLVRHLAPNTQNSIIAVQNTGNASADITLQLYNARRQPRACIHGDERSTPRLGVF